MSVDNQSVEDEDGDLGHEVTPAEGKAAEKLAEQARGADGKFVKAELTDEEKEAEAAAAAAAAAEAGEVAEEEEEEEEEGEELTDEEKEAAAAAAAAAEKPNRLSKRIDTITRQRNEANAAAEAATARAEAAERALAAKEGNTKSEIDLLREKRTELQEKVEELRADGNRKEAAAMQGEIDDLNAQIGEIRSAKVASRVAFQQTEADRYNGMLDTLEGKYPIMVKGSDEYDPKFVAELSLLVAGYEKMGIKPTAALDKAAKLLFQEDPFSGKAKKADPVVPGKKPTDVKKNLEAAKKVIPSGGKGGVNDLKHRIEATKLTDKDLDTMTKDDENDLLGNNFTPTED